MKKIGIISTIALLVILLGVVGLTWCFGPVRVLHPTYWMWTEAKADFSPRNWGLFLKDSKRDEIVRQKSEAQLVRMFPHFQDGSTYSPQSYRGKFMSGFEKSYRFMWLEGKEDDWGPCIVLTLGRPPVLYIAKG